MAAGLKMIGSLIIDFNNNDIVVFVSNDGWLDYRLGDVVIPWTDASSLRLFISLRGSGPERSVGRPPGGRMRRKRQVLARPNPNKLAIAGLEGSFPQIKETHLSNNIPSIAHPSNLNKPTPLLLIRYIMKKSKLRKSLIKLNQNTNEISQHLAYLPLLEFSNGTASLNPLGLSVLEELSNGKVFIVGVYSKKRTLINSIYRSNSVLQEEIMSSGVWITNYPRYEYDRQHKFLFLHISFGSPEDCVKIHSICSLICSIILIELAEVDSLSFLSSLGGRIIFNREEKDESINKNERRRELSNLVFLKKSKNKENINDLRRNLRELDDIFQQFKVGNEVAEYHRELIVLKLSNDAFQFESQLYLSKLEDQFRNICISNNKNEELRNGPILKEYLELVVESIEKIGMVDIVACTNNIKISEGYNAYIRSLQYYHSCLKKEIREEGIANLKEILKATREDTIDQFKKYSNDAAYLININEHMDQTQQKLIEENNKTLDLKNLAYLKQSSQDLMARINRQKMTQQQVQPFIQSIIQDYKRQAYGDNKYEILTNYLNVVHSSVAKNVNQSEVNAVRKELDDTRKQRDEFQTALNRLRRQNSDKCCVIM